MSPVEFKKRPCRPVKFKGQGPLCMLPRQQEKEYCERNKSRTVLFQNTAMFCKCNTFPSKGECTQPKTKATLPTELLSFVT